MLINAKRDAFGKIIEVDGQAVPQDYRDPNFEEFDAQINHINQWLSYISAAMRLLWPGFSDEQKAAIAAQAESMAGVEDWRLDRD